MKKLSVLLLSLPLLTACLFNTGKKNDRELVEVKDTNAFNILMSQFANNIETIWGLNEVVIAGAKDYVKYTDNYQTRSHINFEAGVITIETLLTTDTEQHLHRAIVSTLLMSEDPESVDLYSSVDDLHISKEPFLYGQVVDQHNEMIRWEWRANQFADYLITHKLQQRNSGVKTIWSVTIQLVPNHVDKRAHKYLISVRQAARQYGVEESLILAIMQVESSFNPYAVSRSDALGLMQIMQNTAGADVFKLQGKSGKPSRSYLFDPDNNINTGTAYLHILQERYLVGIKHPIAKRHAIITAYNGGAGSVLRIFSNDKDKAIEKINKLTPNELYRVLTTQHPSAESRNYLQKVTQVQRNVRHY